MDKSTLFKSLTLQQDIATRYSNIVLINSKHKDVVVENTIRMWVNTFGVPDKTLTGNEGKFNNEEVLEELHYMSENLNTKVLGTAAAEFPWSNSICEQHNTVIGHTIDKIKNELYVLYYISSFGLGNK